MTIGANYHYVKEVLTSEAQAFTTSWVDLGDEIEMMGYSTLAIWIKLDVAFDSDLRIRALAKLGKNEDTEYVLPIKTLSSSVIKIEDQYFEFTDDVDGNYILEVETSKLIPFIQFQIQIGTEFGAPLVPTYLTSSIITKVLKRGLSCL